MRWWRLLSSARRNQRKWQRSKNFLFLFCFLLYFYFLFYNLIYFVFETLNEGKKELVARTRLVRISGVEVRYYFGGVIEFGGEYPRSFFVSTFVAFPTDEV
jgi:hypothetical protein